MTNDPDPAEEIFASDIVFECPECGKSLVIDQRGAGYIITCPDCRAELQVPELDVSEPSQADTTPGERVELNDTLKALNEKVNRLHQERSLDRDRMKQIGAEVVLIQTALDRIIGILEESSESTAD